jgi:hypothetical protein
MPGDPGVVEDEQAASPMPIRGGDHMAGQLGRREAGQPAVRVAEQGDAGRAEFGGRLPDFLLSRMAQVRVRLVQRGRLAVRVAQDVHRCARRGQLADHSAEAEALVVGMRDHGQHGWPGRKRPAQASAAVL